MIEHKLSGLRLIPAGAEGSKDTASQDLLKPNFKGLPAYKNFDFLHLGCKLAPETVESSYLLSHNTGFFSDPIHKQINNKPDWFIRLKHQKQ